MDTNSNNQANSVSNNQSNAVTTQNVPVASPANIIPNVNERNLSAEISELLDLAIQKNASDLHLTVGVKPMIRIDGKLMAVENKPILTPDHVQRLVYSFMTDNQKERFLNSKEIDFSFSYGDKVRFRVNVYNQKGWVAVALRLIPSKIRNLQELGLPPILEKFVYSSQGFVIVTGPTGHGKSTTLAAIINLINQTRADHIITIEDPIEYVFQHDKSVIEQREVFNDTKSFGKGLRSVLREDPNVALVGEMRDLESIEAALTIAETGHLVFTTLHTNNAWETIDRIVTVFPPHQQTQIRMQLANVLVGVISQRLIRRIGGGRIPAVEIMLANSAVRNVIREGKTYQLSNILQTSLSEGMINLDKVLADLVSKGDISVDDALAWAQDPKALKMAIY